MTKIVITKVVKQMINYYGNDEINADEILDDFDSFPMNIPNKDDRCNYSLSTRFLFEYLLSQKGFTQSEMITLY